MSPLITEYCLFFMNSLYMRLEVSAIRYFPSLNKNEKHFLAHLFTIN